MRMMLARCTPEDGDEGEGWDAMPRVDMARKMWRIKAMLDDGPKKPQSSSSTKEMAMPSVMLSEGSWMPSGWTVMLSCLARESCPFWSRYLACSSYLRWLHWPSLPLASMTVRRSPCCLTVPSSARTLSSKAAKMLTALVTHSTSPAANLLSRDQQVGRRIGEFVDALKPQPLTRLTFWSQAVALHTSALQHHIQDDACPTLDFRIRHAEHARPTRLLLGAGAASPTLPASELLTVVETSSSEAAIEVMREPTSAQGSLSTTPGEALARTRCVLCGGRNAGKHGDAEVPSLGAEQMRSRCNVV